MIYSPHLLFFLHFYPHTMPKGNNFTAPLAAADFAAAHTAVAALRAKLAFVP